MSHSYDFSDEELDALIQDLSQKVGKAKILADSSDAFRNLNNLLNTYIDEKRSRPNDPDKKDESGVYIEADPEMADVPFIPPTRKIETF